MAIIAECLSIMESRISEFTDGEFNAWSALHIGEMEDYFVERDAESGKVGDIINGICYKNDFLNNSKIFFITDSAKNLLLKKEESAVEADLGEADSTDRQILKVDDKVWETAFGLKKETIDLYEQNPPPLIDANYDPELWVAIDIRIDNRLIGALRALRGDEDNMLFRLATDEGGQCLLSSSESDCSSGIFYVAKKASNLDEFLAYLPHVKNPVGASDIDALIDYLHIIKNLSNVSKNVIGKTEKLISQMEKIAREIDRRTLAERFAVGPGTGFAVAGAAVTGSLALLGYLFYRIFKGNGEGGGSNGPLPPTATGKGAQDGVTQDGGEPAPADAVPNSGGQREFSMQKAYNTRVFYRPYDPPLEQGLVDELAVLVSALVFVKVTAVAAAAGASALAGTAAGELGFAEALSLAPVF